MSKDTARKAEAKNEPVIVEWRQHKFVIPRALNEWSVDLLESLEENKTVGIVRGALGPTQWAAFMATNPLVSDLAELSTLISQALGFKSMGESQPSPT